MGWFVFGALIGIIGVILLIASIFVGKQGYGRDGTSDRPLVIIGGIACLFIFVLFWCIGGVKSVPTKSIGIPISFGKISGQPYGPGAHFTWQPWLHLADVSERVQTTTFEVNSKDQGGLQVRIGGQQTARLDVTIQWQIWPSAADGLFLDYGTNANIMGDVQDAVVVRQLKVAANDVMGDYNPIQDVSANATSGNSQFTQFGPQIKTAMTHDIGRRVHVITVLIPLAHYDSTTQARLNSIQTQYADTAIATQQYKTNLALARANNALAASVSHDPNVLVAQCLVTAGNAIKQGYQGVQPGLCLNQANVLLNRP
jgi:regulator of protease activity HflC (stomatin/prohibitin superfamily)